MSKSISRSRPPASGGLATAVLSSVLIAAQRSQLPIGVIAVRDCVIGDQSMANRLSGLRESRSHLVALSTSVCFMNVTVDGRGFRPRQERVGLQKRRPGNCERMAVAPMGN